MDFLSHVRNGDVAGPLRRGFSIQKWTHEYSVSDRDAVDTSLHDVGLLVYKKAQEIRSKLKITFSGDLIPTTKLRLFAALANYDLCMVQRKVRERLPQTVIGNDTVVVPDVQGIKIKLRSGAEYSPDEIVQSLVDSAQVPIKVILEGHPDLAGTPKFSKVQWNDVFAEFNLAGLYSHLESIWDHCLWNGYQPHIHLEGITFEPQDDIWQKRLAGSQYRNDNLGIQFIDMTRVMLSRLDQRQMSSLVRTRDVRAIKKEKRKQVILLASQSAPTSAAAEALLAFRLLATETYYAELLRETIDLIGGASIDDLLSAWGVVSRAADIQREQLVSLVFPEDASPHSWAPQFAPLLQIEALVDAITKAVGLNHQKAKSILTFLVYRGESSQELWAQPLVPVSKEAVVPLFPALAAPNLARIVDIWLNQLGIDLGRRGPAFERHVRSEVGEAITSSPMLGNSTVLDSSFTFRPYGDREEEIDVVIVLGDLVLLGEVKCVVHPTEAKEYAMHRKTVIDAAAQIQRKQSSAIRHAAEFRDQLAKRGVMLPAAYRVEPLVLLNGPIHAGFEVDSVPIVDLPIVRVFFDGAVRDVVVRNSTGKFEDIATRPLYKDASEASQIAPAYFREPPQLDVVWKGIQQRWIPIAQISANDTPWSYLTYNCVLNIKHIAELLSKNGPQHLTHGS